MDLYHLDWKKTQRAGADTLLAIVSPFPGDASGQAEQAAKAYARGDYAKVATLTGYEMADVYPMTQNLDEGWTDNLPEGVSLASPGPHRSTSCGDILVSDDGVPYVFGPRGFVELTGPASSAA
jgi:hypothetical protein